MESDGSYSIPKVSSLRWQILRRALLRRPSNLGFDDNPSDKISLDKVSRKTRGGFNLIPFHVVNEIGDNSDSLPKRDGCLCYTLPLPNAPKLFLRQRWEDCVDLHDFEVCKQYDIDNTGLVCQWPTEEVLAYYSLSHVDSFRDKRVIELGSGYGLAGLAIAMATEAVEVVISDGNPQVVDCFVDICRQLKYLLTILVGCFHDFMPLVHGPSQLDLQSCDYMQFILQSIDIIARFLVEGISGSELNPKVIPTCEKRSMAAYSQIISPMTLKKL